MSPHPPTPPVEEAVSSLDQRVPIRITNFNTGYGVDVEVDGQKLRNLSDVRFSAVEENSFIPTLVVSMLVLEPVVIEVDARVTVNVIPPVGCVFTQMKSHDGERTMVTVKRPYDV